MHHTGPAIILSTRRFGEHGAIARMLFLEHGIYGGMAKYAFSSKQRGVYMPGNIVNATWHARTQEQMGSFQAESTHPFGALAMQNAATLHALCAACALVEGSLAERDPHPALYTRLHALLEILVAAPSPFAEGDAWPFYYAHFELFLLAELGFGLDLSACAATGTPQDLAYISPKTGRAVCKDAGAPYHHAMLAMPGLFHPQRQGESRSPHEEALDALRVTGYFLEKWVFAPRGLKMPAARGRLVETLAAAQETPAIRIPEPA